MIDVKKLSTKDKSIHINIKYLNYIPISNKINKKNKNEFKIYKPCNIFNISLFSIKNNNSLKKKKIPKKVDNNLNYKLDSIKEENKTDLIDLSDNNSRNYEENKKKK